ncbi:MAG: primosomal protein N' [Bacteroidetes bacterium]|nr:primosomal protein N' [Bacteroidota bacterium]
MKHFANVVLRLPIQKEFTYKIPNELQTIISIGSIVEVPFGKRKLTGVVSSFPETSTIQNIKNIISIAENNITLSPDLIELGKWMSEYYHAPLGDVLNSFYPTALTEPNVKEKTETFISLSKNKIDLKLTAKQNSVISFLKNKENVKLVDLLNELKLGLSVIHNLVDKNILIAEKRKIVAVDNNLVSTQQLPVMLTAEQLSVFEKIKSSITKNHFKTFLLHGITGSGKTEVYIEALRECLSNGKKGIVLVPEISLTPQTVARFRKHFPNEVAVIHSRITKSEKINIWKNINNGKFSIVIGPRSALFSPVKNIGIIVVDEEHETTYKQYDSSPRYHARDVAIIRAKLNNAIVILGSSTPSLETYYNALNGKFELLELKNRIDNATLPVVHLVDLKVEIQKFKQTQKELKIKTFTHPPALSEYLKEKINDRLQKKEGIILFQNRRGFAPLLICEECGFTKYCKNCEVTLTYHKKAHHLRCHYCGNVEKVFDNCENCKGSKIRFQGFGTQRVEEEILKEFPSAKLVRMDLDTTTEKNSHFNLLEKFSTGECDILLGTQMVAKGLDFEHVTLVGIISADTQIVIPDFRSAERTFQLLTQVAGRAGRGKLKGEVVLQTYSPNNYAIQFALNHDFIGFYNKEVEARSELLYPPFSRLILFEVKSKSNDAAQKSATDIFNNILKSNINCQTLGPSPALIERVNNFYRWHVLLKIKKPFAENYSRIKSIIEPAINFHQKKYPNIQLTVDVDPIGIL